MIVTITYVTYLLISLMITIWVAHTLSVNGYLFLVDGFNGDEALARSVNHLLVVGFYLINMGYVTLALRFGDRPTNLPESIEILSTKIGLVLLVLGFMHFFNIKVINTFRDRLKKRANGTPLTA
jgi:hypothetical protein